MATESDRMKPKTLKKRWDYQTIYWILHQAYSKMDINKKKMMIKSF